MSILCLHSLDVDVLVKNNNKVEITKNIVVWIIIFPVKKLETIATRAPMENQKIKKPKLIISITRNIPANINHTCHIYTSIYSDKE